MPSSSLNAQHSYGSIRKKNSSQQFGLQASQRSCIERPSNEVSCASDERSSQTTNSIVRRKRSRLRDFLFQGIANRIHQHREKKRLQQFREYQIAESLRGIRDFPKDLLSATAKQKRRGETQSSGSFVLIPDLPKDSRASVESASVCKDSLDSLQTPSCCPSRSRTPSAVTQDQESPLIAATRSDDDERPLTPSLTECDQSMRRCSSRRSQTPCCLTLPFVRLSLALLPPSEVVIVTPQEFVCFASYFDPDEVMSDTGDQQDDDPTTSSSASDHDSTEHKLYSALTSCACCSDCPTRQSSVKESSLLASLRLTEHEEPILGSLNRRTGMSDPQSKHVCDHCRLQCREKKLVGQLFRGRRFRRRKQHLGFWFLKTLTRDLPECFGCSGSDRSWSEVFDHKENRLTYYCFLGVRPIIDARIQRVLNTEQRLSLFASHVDGRDVCNQPPLITKHEPPDRVDCPTLQQQARMEGQTLRPCCGCSMNSSSLDHASSVVCSRSSSSHSDGSFVPSLFLPPSTLDTPPSLRLSRRASCPSNPPVCVSCFQSKLQQASDCSDVTGPAESGEILSQLRDFLFGLSFLDQTTQQQQESGGGDGLSPLQRVANSITTTLQTVKEHWLLQETPTTNNSISEAFMIPSRD